MNAEIHTRIAQDGNMTRFTLRDTKRSVSMRLDLDPRDPAGEISRIANGYWGSEGFLMRNGYRLIPQDETIGEGIDDGDTVDLIPDPSRL